MRVIERIVKWVKGKGIGNTVGAKRRKRIVMDEKHPSMMLKCRNGLKMGISYKHKLFICLAINSQKKVLK